MTNVEKLVQPGKNIKDLLVGVDGKSTELSFDSSVTLQGKRWSKIRRSVSKVKSEGIIPIEATQKSLLYLLPAIHLIDPDKSVPFSLSQADLDLLLDDFTSQWDIGDAEKNNLHAYYLAVSSIYAQGPLDRDTMEEETNFIDGTSAGYNAPPKNHRLRIEFWAIASLIFPPGHRAYQNWSRKEMEKSLLFESARLEPRIHDKMFVEDDLLSLAHIKLLSPETFNTLGFDQTCWDIALNYVLPILDSKKPIKTSVSKALLSLAIIAADEIEVTKKGVNVINHEKEPAPLPSSSIPLPVRRKYDTS